MIEQQKEQVHVCWTWRLLSTLEALIYLVTDNKAQKYFNSVINLYFDEILMANFIRSLLADRYCRYKQFTLNWTKGDLFWSVVFS